jgi:hypothetical protein
VRRREKPDEQDGVDRRRIYNHSYEAALVWQDDCFMGIATRSRVHFLLLFAIGAPGITRQFAAIAFFCISPVVSDLDLH